MTPTSPYIIIKPTHTEEAVQSHMKISATNARQCISDSEEELRRRTRQGWHRGRSSNGPPVASHRTPPGTRHRSFDFTATNNPRQTHGHAEEEPTTSTSAMSPTSLDITIVATETSYDSSYFLLSVNMLPLGTYGRTS
jgi:hypothetical protein